MDSRENLQHPLLRRLPPSPEKYHMVDAINQHKEVLDQIIDRLEHIERMVGIGPL